MFTAITKSVTYISILQSIIPYRMFTGITKLVIATYKLQT